MKAIRTSASIYNEKQTIAEFELLEFDPTTVGTLTLTKTMLDKCIIDANASIRQLARLFDVDYEELQAGERVQVPSILQDKSEATVTFYKTARGDRRISIQKIKQIASEGDTISLTWARRESGELILVLNK
tara:strand:- start:128 stop:520 length:393 start_codon:yes stop_codon:yes gene_type:complete